MRRVTKHPQIVALWRRFSRSNQTQPVESAYDHAFASRETGSDGLDADRLMLLLRTRLQSSEPELPKRRAIAGCEGGADLDVWRHGDDLRITGAEVRHMTQLRSSSGRWTDVSSDLHRPKLWFVTCYIVTGRCETEPTRS